MIRLALFVLALLHGTSAMAAVGFQWASAPDPNGQPLQVAIWYPTDVRPAFKQIGPFQMNVAMDASVKGQNHALIVMSHGTGGMALNSYDTAMALAEAGFIVAAVTHAGDNYQNHSVSFTKRNFIRRPAQVSRVIDFMLSRWPSHSVIDPHRIGVLGHSAGGATALVIGGGVGDWQRALDYCRAHPDDWGCTRARAAGTSEAQDPTEKIAGHDKRVRALVLAAPALASIFAPSGLSAVTVPVQLWVGQRDDIVPDAAQVRTLLPRAPDYHLVANAGHFAYLAPCNEILRSAAPEICVDPKGFDREAFLRTFQRQVIAFYRKALGSKQNAMIR
jgi:predicted dienelactone hydrolase